MQLVNNGSLALPGDPIEASVSDKSERARRGVCAGARASSWQAAPAAAAAAGPESCDASPLAATASVEQLDPWASAAAVTFSFESRSGGAASSGSWAVLEPSGGSG